MKIRNKPPLHLTYCLNIHAGETWEENFAAIRSKVVKVRNAVGDKRPFGLGMRLSNIAARKLAGPRAMALFRDFLAANNMYVFTINGFPYGAFHGKPVKADVYQPDWRTPERLRYTILLADILAQLLPENVPGSISTVPCSYKAWIKNKTEVNAMVNNLIDCAEHLRDIRKRTGRDICLALEPEPDCLLETTDEVVDFFKSCIRHSIRTSSKSGNEISRHLGVCFDTCHLAVQFEDLCASLRKLKKNGISIPKIQLSAAIRTMIGNAALRGLESFCDSVYLHQVRLRGKNGKVECMGDLSAALLEDLACSRGTELRAHFHVPLYFKGTGSLKSTSSDLTPEFFRAVLAARIPHLEIETYTFDVLPEKLRSIAVTESIAREYDWTLRQLNLPVS